MQNMPTYPNRRQALTTAFSLVATPWVFAQTPAYADETWQDARRQRAVPVRIRWPQSVAPADGWPVIVYSHGLGGSRAGGDVWGQAWADSGFVVVHLQHAGSDTEAVMQALVKNRSLAGLQEVANAQQLMARIDDVVFAIDEVARRMTIDKAWRFARADGVGVAGHSFGAHTTLGAGGQAYPLRGALREPRIAALAAFSPSLPVAGDAVKAFAQVQRPTLCLTGTRDDDVIGNGATADKRAAVYAALPAGNKAMLLLKDADHMTFGGGRDSSRPETVEGRMRPREAITTQLQPQHHALVARITTDWWRAHLMGDATAKARLQRPTGLAAQDTWQTG